jgi:DNA (cytosine-5)-methyltransferase 1
MLHHELQVKLAMAHAPATTVGDALADLPRITDHLGISEARRREDFRVWRYYDREPDSAYAQLMRRWPGLRDPAGVADHVIRRTPRDYETFREMRPDDRYPDAMRIAEQRFDDLIAKLTEAGTAPLEGTPLYDELHRRIVPPYPVDRFVDKWRKLNRDRPSWTVPAHLAKDAYSHIHYDDAQARTISVREAARLQSFPDGFEFAGNMGDCFTQIGNAVAPLLAWRIAAHVLAVLGFRFFPPGIAGVATGS